MDSGLRRNLGVKVLPGELLKVRPSRKRLSISFENHKASRILVEFFPNISDSTPISWVFC